MSGSSSVGRMITSKLDDLLTQLGTGNMHLAPHTLGISFLAPMMDYSCVPPDHAFTITSITYDADGTNHTTMYGRKTMLSIGLFAYFSIATASTWIPVFSGILVVRFILGLFHPVVLQSGYILVMEVTEPRYRSVVGILISLPWAIGTVAWGAIAYFLRDWKWLQLAVTLPVFLLLPLLWFIDESPRWLIVNGHIDRAHKVLKKAARWNHSSLPPAEELTILMRAIQKESATAKDAAREEHGELTCKQRVCNSIRRLFILFRTPKLLLITVMLCFNFFSVGSIYYGMSLNAVNYSADPHVYMMLGGVVEIPAYTVTAPIIARFGRKWPNIVFYLICGSVIMALAFIPSKQQKKRRKRRWLNSEPRTPLDTSEYIWTPPDTFGHLWTPLNTFWHIWTPWTRPSGREGIENGLSSILGHLLLSEVSYS
ncbi:Organic cation transporter protein-like 4 [Homarus americanus]|uniref:Organic cation transporter protein-like 4 n=1 Tax=Homarus americanus TaxID=6706 RepID=A0A8J5MMW5_HOMAM|nr:Organic cation transporter protein-like 4 [Homarus americanus]